MVSEFRVHLFPPTFSNSSTSTYLLHKPSSKTIIHLLLPYMELHVMPPSSAVDFTFDSSTSTSTSPYATAPSSPHSTIPFTWEHKPGIPKHNNFQQHDTDFAFVYPQRHSISAADDLFDSGKIKPLKPPPRLHTPNGSPKSSKSPKSRLKDALYPRNKPNEFDPFSEAFKQTSCEQTLTDGNPSPQGRQRTTKNNRHKSSQSLSPFRVSDIVNSRKNSSDQSPPAGLTTWYDKWNIKNLLLFRRASEGSVTTRKDSMYTMLNKDERFSFRSTGGLTAAEEMKTKSGLPFKLGMMGCLRFHQNAGNFMKQ
ncbi:hypothetical protein L1987_70790 [Smallanthus sonchifolius]|uniref:Uncharacterized protein n=1 Tax=Smallanthus sonchifolius TaxID=185202 RepID=A0ACB9ARH4_9ASTR|nr:hypothetical protein L1987_70790 [Smallanthus sonchifolius]